MENTTGDLFDDELKMDATAKNHLKGIATWAMIVVVTAVLGYIVTIADTFLSPAYQVGRMREGFTASVAFGQKSMTGAIIQTVIGLIIHFFLYRFCVLISQSVRAMDQDKTGAAFRNLKIYFAITGVISVIVALAVLILLAAMI
ncbi:MAG TPA: hypothetical protein PKC69_06275 [Chitinophagaceae bacterium]|nr:hypothetical protein [Chitinophagaceae bacterium]